MKYDYAKRPKSILPSLTKRAPELPFSTEMNRRLLQDLRRRAEPPLCDPFPERYEHRTISPMNLFVWTVILSLGACAGLVLVRWALGVLP